MVLFLFEEWLVVEEDEVGQALALVGADAVVVLLSSHSVLDAHHPDVGPVPLILSMKNWEVR